LRRYSRLGTSLDGRRLGRGLQGVQNGLGVTAGLGQSPLSILSVLVHAASPSESISFRAAHRTAKKRARERRRPLDRYRLVWRLGIADLPRGLVFIGNSET
jgi:hypothetical protein